MDGLDESMDGVALWRAGGLSDLKRAQLQRLCKDCGLKASGKNVEMAERLSDFYASNAPSGEVDLSSVITKNDEDELEVAVASSNDIVSTPSKASSSAVKLSCDHIDITKASSTPEKRQRTKSVAEIVLDELEVRIQENLKVTSDRPRPSLTRSKSFAASTASSALKHVSKWDTVHKKQFDRMDSIASHYAGKRSTSTAGSYKSSALPLKKPDGVKKVEGRNLIKKFISFNSPSSPATATAANAGSKRTVAPKVVSIKSGKSVADVENQSKKANSTLSHAPVSKKFDLKASLARPLTYKPYTGKLAPVKPLQPVPLTSTSNSGPSNFAASVKKRLSIGKK